MKPTLHSGIVHRLDTLIEALNAEQNKDGASIDVWRWIPRAKYVAIDCGRSGAFLVDIATEELFNLKGYGVPDHNKKRKADLGNLATVDPKILFSKRWNYLR